jgi:cell pole-organizing protein PopZ
MAGDKDLDNILASIRRIVVEDPVTVLDLVTPEPATANALKFVAVPDHAETMTLDALVRSMIEPLLEPAIKRWLDAHLPEIVEAATHAEIKRLTGN